VELVWIASHSPEGQVVGAVRLPGQQTGPDFPSTGLKIDSPERVEQYW